MKRVEEKTPQEESRDGQSPEAAARNDSGPPTHSPSLSRTAIIIGVVSLLADVSSEMVYPLIPIFVTQVLAAPATAVGLIEGVATGTSSIIAGISGWTSDRIGRRKPIAFAGYALTAVARPIMGLAGSWPVVLGARFSERFGKGIRAAPRDALLADSSGEQNRGRAFGFERAMDSAGAVLGPLLALLLVGAAGLGVRSVILLSCIPATAAALLILTVRESRGSVGGGRSLKLSLAGTTRTYRRVLLIAGVFGLANSANAFLILRSGQLGLSAHWTILAYALYNAVAALASMPAGAASDRFGRRNLLVLGYAIYSAVYVGFGAANQAWVVWPLFAIYGLFPALTDGVAKALAVDTAGEAGRATVIGIYSAVIGLTQIAASLIGGLLWDEVGAQATFYFGASMSALSIVLLLALIPARTRPQTLNPERAGHS
ncbi:MAG TPA: MFS transporter [Blastocatellia bacterium]|nr:MFS transporter [Blastocatellia bacterium]